MTRRILLVGTLLICAQVSSACQQTDQSTTVAGGGTVTLTQEEFISAYQELSCLNLERCCTLANLGFDSTVCSTLFANAGQGTESTVFKPEHGAQCLSDLAASTECSVFNVPSSCAHAYSGTRMPGESCSSNLDCRQPTNGDSTCDALRGICIGGYRAGLGTTCQQSCEQSDTTGLASCTWGPASNVADSGTVVVNCFVNDGLTCGPSGRCESLAETGQPCANDSTCNRALYCAISASGVGSNCQPRGTIGSPCVDYAAPCVTSAYCSAGTCTAKKAAGQRCLSNAECLGICHCGLSGDCATTGVCADPNALALGFTNTVLSATYCVAAYTQP